MASKKLIIKECEVCGEKDKSCLEVHHIIPRTDPRCTNDSHNCAIICSSCHSKHHRGSLKIIGVHPSTKPPNNRTLIYELNGKKNIDLDPYLPPKQIGMKVFV